MNIEWYLTEIHTDVGVGPNSIKDSLKLLRLKNAMRPAAKQASSDDIAEMLQDIDKDESGEIDFSEFCDLIGRSSRGGEIVVSSRHTRAVPDTVAAATQSQASTRACFRERFRHSRVFRFRPSSEG